MNESAEFIKALKPGREGFMKILKEHNIYGWITAIVCDRWCQAKVYDLPSTFGINGGRVSKLAVSKTDSCIHNSPFHEQMDYNYDRGLDFNNLEPELIDSIVYELDRLPKLK